MPAELSGDYRSRIVVGSRYVAAARVVDGPALTSAATRTLKTVARAAAVAKVGGAVGPLGSVAAGTTMGLRGDELTLVIEDGVATETLHAWVTGDKTAVGQEVAVDLFDDGERSSTLELEGSRVVEHDLEEDPARPGTYLVHRLVLAQSAASWVVAGAEPVGEVLAEGGASGPPPCRGSFRNGVAAGLAFAVVSAGLVVSQQPFDPTVTGADEGGRPECDARGEPARCATPGGPTTAPPRPVPGPVRVPILRPIGKPFPVPRPVPKRFRVPVAVPDPYLVPFPKPYPVPEPYPVPKPYPVPNPYPVPDPYPVPYPAPVPRPFPTPGSPGCKQPPGSVVTSEAHARHPGCAKWHSRSEPPGHSKRGRSGPPGHAKR